MKNKAFTLIELLAVIVVLGIIMLIAVTAVSNVISNAKMNSFKTSAMMVAKKIRTETLSYGYTDNYSINCLTGDYGLNPNDYEYCSANVSNVNDQTKVYVDLIGKGGFNGISTIGATVDQAPIVNNVTYQVLKDVLLAPANIKGNVTYGDPGSITGGLYQWGSKYIYRGGISRTGASLNTINYASDTVSTTTDITNYVKVPWENNSVACNNTYSDNPCWKIISVNSDGSITIVRDRNLSTTQMFDNSYNSAAADVWGYNDLLENIPTSGHPEEYRAKSLMYDYLYGTTGYQNTILKNYYSLLNTSDVCLNKTNNFAGVNSLTYATTTRVTNICDITGKSNSKVVNPYRSQYVRLPYIDEYLNASLSSATAGNVLCAQDYEYQCRNKNFLYNQSVYWSINGHSSFSWYVRYVSARGHAGEDYAANLFGVRPVVTLKSTVLITGGTGSVSDPYIIKS